MLIPGLQGGIEKAQAADITRLMEVEGICMKRRRVEHHLNSYRRVLAQSSNLASAASPTPMAQQLDQQVDLSRIGCCDSNASCGSGARNTAAVWPRPARLIIVGALGQSTYGSSQCMALMTQTRQHRQLMPACTGHATSTVVTHCVQVNMLQPGSSGEGQPVTVSLIVRSSSLDGSTAVRVTLAARPEGSPKQAGKPDSTKPPGTVCTPANNVDSL